MISTSLVTWQEMNNYRKENDVVYGVYQGCGFTVTEEDGGTLFIFMLSQANDTAFDAMEGALINAGGILAMGQVGDVESYLAVFFESSLSASDMDKVLQFISANAKQNGFRVPNVCVKCGARATKRSFVDDMVQPLCADCSVKVKQERATKAKSQAAAAPMPYDDQTAQYAQQYAPITADSSKYDDSYDEYAGMAPHINDHEDNFVYGSNYANANNDSYKSNNTSSDNFAFSGSNNDYDDYNSHDDYGNNDSSNDTEIGGNLGMGILGALAGSLLGIVLYVVVALVAHFPMGALCCPAGMLAVVFYTLLGGQKSKGLGMGASISFGAVVSAITVFLTSVMSYTNSSVNFSGAMEYLMGDPVQKRLLYINLLLAVLGAIFGACFFINVMDKYVDGDDSSK